MTITKFKGNYWNLIAGIAMMLLGVMVLFNPFGTMLALAFYIGIAFILVGAFYVMSSIYIKSGWYLLVGVLDLVVGFILMSNLGVTAVSLPIILALWSLTVGIIQIIGALELKKYGLPWGWSVLMGITGAIFGFVILAYPMVGAFTISTILGLYAILFALLQLAEYQMSKNTYKIVIDRA